MNVVAEEPQMSWEVILLQERRTPCEIQVCDVSCEEVFQQLQERLVWMLADKAALGEIKKLWRKLVLCGSQADFSDSVRKKDMGVRERQGG